MKAYGLIQVLWVEDDPQVIDAYPMEAEQEGLQLVPYACWDDAKKALEDESDRWSAIVLDAKCKQHRDSADNAVRFLSEALKDISRMSEKKSRDIPWYILTGGDEAEISYSINDDRKRWDKDWTESTHKKFYSKNTDRDMLYKRIRTHALKSSRLQIQTMYRDVFDAIERNGISDDAYNALEDLLMPIHFPNIVADHDYNDKFAKVRTFLEYLFRAMSEKGLLPDFGNKWNLVWSSLLLSGKDATVKDKEIIVVKAKKKVLPKVLSGIVRGMVENIPQGLHSHDGKDNDTLTEYIKNIGTSNLLKSYALQLCDIVLWYDRYIQQHDDKEANSQNWEILRQDLMCKK